ncbi:MAG: glycosyl transferase [Thermomicrobiales bacterium]|nr:MAG: glycosyl transferase [Thermomicrobiales bacterium]
MQTAWPGTISWTQAAHTDPERLRLLFVITRGDEAGGAQAYVRDLATALAHHGHDVLVVTGTSGVLTSQLASAGVPVAVLPALVRDIQPQRDLASVRQLSAVIHRFRPQLISAHSSKAGMIGRLAAWRAGVPCVFTVHGWAFNPSEPWPVRQCYRAIERIMAPLAARIICVSEDSRQRGIAAGIAPDRLVTIHTGIPDVEPALRAQPGAAGPLRIITVARFAPPKDYRTLLLALHGVDGVTLDCVGDGPLLPEMRALAASLGIADRVRFLGHRDDVPRPMAESHVFVLSSRSEGFPISTLEAMRAGLPVIVTAVGGAPEAVLPGRTGFTVPAGDPEALRLRLRQLAADPELRTRLGAAGRRHFEHTFTFARMYDATLALYASVATRSSHAWIRTFGSWDDANPARRLTTVPEPAVEIGKRGRCPQGSEASGGS